MPGPVTETRSLRDARRELFSRPPGQRGVCPGCGDPVVLCRYIPREIVPGSKRSKLVYDLPPADRADEYANHAASLSLRVTHLITEDWPLADTEKRLTLHIATHPRCEPFLTRGHP